MLTLGSKTDVLERDWHVKFMTKLVFALALITYLSTHLMRKSGSQALGATMGVSLQETKHLGGWERERSNVASRYCVISEAGV